MPGVVAALMWGYLYGPSSGRSPSSPTRSGLRRADLLSRDRMLCSIANIVNWEFIGYNMIILYAALRADPDRAVRGGAPWTAPAPGGSPGAIKIPAIRPALLLTLIFSVIGSFQLFTEPQLLHAWPRTSSAAHCTPNLYAYTWPSSTRTLNYAAAVSFLLGLVIVVRVLHRPARAPTGGAA